jgi:hypothetical protein
MYRASSLPAHCRLLDDLYEPGFVRLMKLYQMLVGGPVVISREAMLLVFRQFNACTTKLDQVLRSVPEYSSRNWIFLFFTFIFSDKLPSNVQEAVSAEIEFATDVDPIKLIALLNMPADKERITVMKPEGGVIISYGAEKIFCTVKLKLIKMVVFII